MTHDSVVRVPRFLSCEKNAGETLASLGEEVAVCERNVASTSCGSITYIIKHSIIRRLVNVCVPGLNWREQRDI